MNNGRIQFKHQDLELIVHKMVDMDYNLLYQENINDIKINLLQDLLIINLNTMLFRYLHLLLLWELEQKQNK